MNYHGDHKATCYCCKHVYMEYEHDYSDVTPGAGFEFGCYRGHFVYGQSHLDKCYNLAATLHQVMTLAQECQDFEAREDDGL